jgi:hypothetical protein
MTELEAVRILRSQLSGPSARWDAEAELRARNWPELAIRLAKDEDIGPAGSLDDHNTGQDQERDAVLRRFAPPAPWSRATGHSCGWPNPKY